MTPATRDALLAIARRLEGAGGPSRLLDAAVGAVVGDEGEDTPPYTASIDAAVALVPPWALWTARTLWSGADYDRTACVVAVTAYRFPEQTVRFTCEAQARTAALALCAAALRLRARG